MEGDGRANDTYGSALAAHPGKSQGRPPTNTGSQPIEQDRPARPRLLPDAPVPDDRTVLTNPDVQDIEAVGGHRQHPSPFIRDTNPLERFNREIARRTDVVGIFPDDASVIRLVSMLAIEANDEWLVGRSYISRGSMTTLYETRSALAPKTEEKKEVNELIAA
jgi:Transposase, Mutator family